VVIREVPVRFDGPFVLDAAKLKEVGPHRARARDPRAHCARAEQPRDW
jgi:hypothetical protein